MNPSKPPFDDPKLRQALREAINREGIVDTVWGDLAGPSSQLLPAGMLPAKLDSDPIDYDPSALEQAVASLPAASRHVTLVFNMGEGQEQKTAEYIGNELSEAGLDVKLIAPSTGEEWWKPDPPNLFVSTSNPDAANPAAWASVFYATESSLNYLGGGSKAADQLLSRAASSPTKRQADALFSEAMAEIRATNTFITIADPKNAYAAVEGFHGWGANVAAPFSLAVAEARLAGAR